MIFPRFEPEASKYDLNYWSHDWEQVALFQEMTNSLVEISAFLLWMQGTPKTKLGDVFQDISMIEKDGHRNLKDFGLEGLKQELEKHFAPDQYVQFEKAMYLYQTYNELLQRGSAILHTKAR